MKHLLNFKVLLFCVAVLSFYSCSETNTSVDSNTYRLKGSIVGNVKLSDLYGAPTESSGIKVSLEGTTINSATDSSGKYTLTEVPAGIYTIEMSKDGYGKKKYYGYQFVGGGIGYVGSAQLNMISINTASLEEIIVKDTIYANLPSIKYTIHGRIVSPTDSNLTHARGLLFYSKTPDVSCEPGKYIGIKNVSVNESPYYIQGQYYAEFFQFKNQDMSFGKSGDTIYMVTYAISPGNGYYPPVDYYDYTIESDIYTSLSPTHSEVRSFVIQ